MIRERHPRHTVTGNDGQSGPPTGRPFHKKFKTRDGAAGSRPPARPQQVANTGNKKRCSASDQFLLRSSQNEPAKAVMLFAYRTSGATLLFSHHPSSHQCVQGYPQHMLRPEAARRG